MAAMERSAALEACLAIRVGNREQAREAFAILLRQEDGASILRGVQDVLLAAVRRHQQELFCDLLLMANPVLLALLRQKDLAEASSGFLQAVVFAACDRRLLQVLPLLRRQLKTFFVSGTQEDVGCGLWSELLNLCARMARRGWRQETSWLLRLLLWRLLRQKNLRSWQGALLQLQMHMVVYARWDGFTNACMVYGEIQQLLLLLVKRADRAGLEQSLREQYLVLTMRFVRDLVGNVSRARMEDDMEIFLKWHQYLLGLAVDDAGKRRQVLKLLQLSIRYWQSTRPKTSRKQIGYLKELLQPDLVSGQLKEMLEKIS